MTRYDFVSQRNGDEKVVLRSPTSTMQSRRSLVHSIYEERQNDTSLLVQPDTGITLVLDVIGLMCDGQRRSMQDYLRDQPDNFRVCRKSLVKLKLY